MDWQAIFERFLYLSEFLRKYPHVQFVGDFWHDCGFEDEFSIWSRTRTDMGC